MKAMIYHRALQNRPFQKYNVSAQSHADSFVTARAKLESFASLPTGWHYGRGRPATSEVVAKALAFLELAYRLGFRTFEAFPGTDGGVLIAMYVEDHDIEVRINPDLSLRVIHDKDGIDLKYRDGLATDDAILLLTTIAAHVCSFALSTAGITAFIGADSLAKLSSHPMMTASPYSMPTARQLPPGQFANTYTTTIEASQESPRYFGAFTRVNSRQVSATTSNLTKSRVIRATKT